MKMRLIGVNTAIGNEAEEVKLSPGCARVLHGFKQDGMLEEISALDHQLDAGGIHVHDAAGTYVQMSNFAVAHLAVRKSDIGATGLDERIRMLAQQAIIGRLAGKRDGI